MAQQCETGIWKIAVKDAPLVMNPCRKNVNIHVHIQK